MPQAGNHEFKLGLPIFLEDKTGRLTGSDFVDLYSRCRISYQRMLEDSDNMRIKYGVSRYESSRNGPTIILEFGDDNSLGTIKVRESDPIPMDEYLPKVSASASSKSRHFLASNGQRYQWRYRHDIDQEWACTNSKGEVISYYSLKLYGEPPYFNSSGCMLTVEEDYSRLSCEFLATCMIMRHIAEHNL